MNSEISPTSQSSATLQAGYTSPRNISQACSSPYRKIKESKETYVAFINAVKDSLNIHLDIYMSPTTSQRYEGAMKYTYKFISEELSTEKEEEQMRTSYHCHLKGIEIISDEDYSLNTKFVFSFLMQNIIKNGGWVLVSLGDIDIYGRILVNIFDIITRKSLNRDILKLVSPITNKPIAKEYLRQPGGKKQFVANKQEFHYVVKKSKMKIEED